MKMVFNENYLACTHCTKNESFIVHIDESIVNVYKKSYKKKLN